MRMTKEIMRYVRNRITDKAAPKIERLKKEHKSWYDTMKPKPEEVADYEKHLIEMKNGWEKELRAYLSACPLADHFVLEGAAKTRIELRGTNPDHVKEAWHEYKRLDDELDKLNKTIEDVCDEIIAKLSLGGKAEDMERMIAEIKF